MTTTADQQATQTLFHLPVGPERTLTLPDDLLRQLGVEPGDVVTFSVHAGYAMLHRARADKPPDSIEVEPVPDLEGLLSDYFVDHEDVLRFIEEERGGSSESSIRAAGARRFPPACDGLSRRRQRRPHGPDGQSASTARC